VTVGGSSGLFSTMIAVVTPAPMIAAITIHFCMALALARRNSEPPTSESFGPSGLPLEFGLVELPAVPQQMLGVAPQKIPVERRLQRCVSELTLFFCGHAECSPFQLRCCERKDDECDRRQHPF
jgi:hypothetical protein